MNQWSSEWINEVKWVDEPMKRWFSESMEQWSDKSMKRWLNERMHEWTSKFKMNQWIDDWVKRWVNDSVIQCNEPKKHWWSESTNRWMILCWATSSLSDLFEKAPLLSTTSSLGSHLSGLPLLWPTSQLAHCSFCNSILLFAQLFHYFLAKLLSQVDAEIFFSQIEG